MKTNLKEMALPRIFKNLKDINSDSVFQDYVSFCCQNGRNGLLFYNGENGNSFYYLSPNYLFDFIIEEELLNKLIFDLDRTNTFIFNLRKLSFKDVSEIILNGNLVNKLTRLLNLTNNELEKIVFNINYLYENITNFNSEFFKNHDKKYGLVRLKKNEEDKFVNICDYNNGVPIITKKVNIFGHQQYPTVEDILVEIKNKLNFELLKIPSQDKKNFHYFFHIAYMNNKLILYHPMYSISYYEIKKPIQEILNVFSKFSFKKKKILI